MRRLVRQQLQEGVQRVGPRREAEAQAVGEHEAVDALRNLRVSALQRRAQPHEAGLVERVPRMDAIAGAELQAEPDVRFRIGIHEALLACGDLVEPGDVGGAGIHHRPLQQPALGQRFGVRKALLGAHHVGCVHAAGEGQGGIHDDVLLCADAFDDRRVQIRIVLLPAGFFVVGVHMDDGRTRASAGDALCNDVLDCDRDPRLSVARPGTVQRHFEPGLTRGYYRLASFVCRKPRGGKCGHTAQQ